MFKGRKNPRILYPRVKLSFKSKKYFLRQTLKEFVASRSALYEMLKKKIFKKHENNTGQTLRSMQREKDDWKRNV